MITKIIIQNPSDTPLSHTENLFKPGLSIDFIDGVNIIVGENGCGKTTLMSLLRHYLMVDEIECGRGTYNHNVNRLRRGISGDIPSGVDVYADYRRNIFNFTHDKTEDTSLASMENFSALYEKKHSSTGEGVMVELGHLFNHMFSKKAWLMFDYSQIDMPSYQDYIKEHRVECPDSISILMDEPDRNLSLEKIAEIEGILSYQKEHTQVIAVIHNPLLIMSLLPVEHINWIELSEGYISKLKERFIAIYKGLKLTEKI